MTGRPLTKKNLVALDADTSASLLLEAVKAGAAAGRAHAFRRSRSEAVTADVRRGFVPTRRARGFMSCKSHTKLTRDPWI